MANKALLVGINKYKIPGSDLSGCVNDVTNIRGMNRDSALLFPKWDKWGHLVNCSAIPEDVPIYQGQIGGQVFKDRPPSLFQPTKNIG
jgi:hypothetical protein